MPSDVIRGALENGERSDTRPFLLPISIIFLIVIFHLLYWIRIGNFESNFKFTFSPVAT